MGYNWSLGSALDALIGR